jgi:hypothetical protein
MFAVEQAVSSHVAAIGLPSECPPTLSVSHP